MYVEVTARKTGKTTRLVDSIIDFLTENPDKSALIVAPNSNYRRHIQDMVQSKCGTPCYYRTITSYKMLQPNPNSTLKQFVDEFGLINDLVLDPQGYYTGTPPFGEKAQRIWEYYKLNNVLKPITRLEKHKL